MALVLADRVLETTAVTGTGNATLAGAQANYQTFSVIGDGSTTYYTIVDNTNNEWEVGIGTYVSVGNYISRDTVLSSSNAGALVYFGSGTKDIFCDLPAEKVASLGALSYQGTWNASTNTPTLASGVGTQGYYYVVSVAGSTDLDGITDWKVNDYAIYNGTAWQKIDNTDAVTSVNGQTGIVVLTASDVGAQPAGTYVTSVGATSPVTSSGGTTPTIAMPAATTSVSGYLTSTDWNTFNGKAPATSGTSILYGNGSGGFSNVTVGSGLTFAGGTLSSAGGSGDVVGPASATDNAIARFDATTGKLIKNSVVTIDDSGNISGANSISTIDYAQLDTTAAASIALGKLRWNVDTATAAFGIIDGTTEVNIGQQMYAYVTNAESVTITAGQAVYLYQATGNRASVKLAYNTGDATSAKTLGLVTADIAAGATGFVTTQGVLAKLNTGLFAEGDTLYLGATAGSLTATKPSAPNHLVYIGVVERANNGNGQIYVRPQNGYELNEIHDVQISSPANGQTILYDASTSLWKNANLTAGTGISISNGAASATITNSAPDQTVAITGAGGAVVTGTYPNFTVTTPSGTVTSVSGTAPVVSSGGATPAISMAAANTTTDGYLTSTDWNTFNGKGNGTVTSVSGTAPISVATGTSTPVVSLDDTAVSPGSYTYASITVDAKGRLTAASNGASPSAFPSGTAMLFVQTSAPTGWTKSTAHDNKALRIVSGTAGTGGSVAFTTAFASQTPTGSISVTVGAGTLAVGAGTFAVGATTLTSTQIPSHAHTPVNWNGDLQKQTSYNGGGSWPTLVFYSNYATGYGNVGADRTTSSTGGGSSHTHSLTGAPSLSGSPSVTASSFTGNAINLAVQYVDVIIATKD